LSGDSYPAEGITESEVTAFAMSSHAFYRCIEQSAFFREFVFKNFSLRLSNLIGRMETVVFDTIDQRICKVLLVSGEEVIVKTHHELAYELGTAREVVSRHLKNFENYGWLSLKRGTITIINRDALERICDKH
jgi:CRP/FNR family transcriptional regulator